MTYSEWLEGARCGVRRKLEGLGGYCVCITIEFPALGYSLTIYSTIISDWLLISSWCVWMCVNVCEYCLDDQYTSHLPLLPWYSSILITFASAELIQADINIFKKCPAYDIEMDWVVRLLGVVEPVKSLPVGQINLYWKLLDWNTWNRITLY